VFEQKRCIVETNPSNDLYSSVIPTLLKYGRGFKNSVEYGRLIGSAEDLPGVVACAYAAYLGRQFKMDPKYAIANLIYPLNLLASWDNSKVNTMLADEVVEQLEADGVLNELEGKFSAPFRKLVDRDSNG
jgi:hypothetical protein